MQCAPFLIILFMVSLQISRFRQLSDVQEGALVDNYRQLQPLGNRRVFMRVGNNHHTLIHTLHNEVDYKKWDWFN